MTYQIPVPSVVCAFVLGCTLLTGCSGTSEENGPSSPTAPSSVQVKVQGAIADLGGSCPNLSFRIGSERVLTNGNTQFQRVACGALRSGTSVEVEGLRQTDGAILAREVELEAVAPAPAGAEVEVEGGITGLGGACPNLTFNVGNARICTAANTEFNRIPCVLLQNGMEVEVEGFIQSDGVILAREVEPDEVRIEGTLAGLGGACPNRTFTVDGQSVITLPTTRFDDVTCGGLLGGMRVEVRAVRRPDGTLLATRVRPEEQRPEAREERLEGSLSGLSGMCPSRAFRVAGHQVTAHSGTRFDDVTCAGLQEGMRVEVRGFRQPQGSILADRVKRKN